MKPPKKLRRIRKPKSLKKICDELWSEVIKAKAGYKSEISGREGKQIGGDYVICAHHIRGKATYRLRYELDNGIVLDNYGEHKWGIHNADRSHEVQKRIDEAIGPERIKRLDDISKFATGGTDLMAVKIYLDNELKKYKKGVQLCGVKKKKNM